MPTNHKGGKKAKKMANHSVMKDESLILADDAHRYATVLKTLGGGTYQVQLIGSSITMRALKRGKHEKGKNRTLFNTGDTILVSLREYQDNTCDIELKYTPKQIHELIKAGELPSEQESTDSIIFEDNSFNDDDFDDL